MTIEYQVAHYSPELCQEMLPLLQANWRESASYEPGIEADPDFERYRRMDAAGLVMCITAREDRRLVGYVVYIVTHATHHKTILCAMGDAIYTDAEHRGLGPMFLKMTENALRAVGVKRLGWSVERGSRLHGLLLHDGWYEDEIVMEKKL